MKVLLILLLPLVINALTLEEKVGQLFMVHFCQVSDAKRLIDEAHVGGFILYNWANKLESEQQVTALTKELQRLSPTPLLIAVDQEGGPVTRLKFAPAVSNKCAGAQAYQQSMGICRTLKACGINFNLAPVADVSLSKGINPERCYGSDPEFVARCVQEALRAYKDAGVLCCLKHFPGHGSVETDSHDGTPHQKKSLEELKKSDLIPFKGADIIMTGHIVVERVDPVYPATLSAKILKGLLRQGLGFKGVIISDSVVMQGLKDFSLEESTKRAFLAGCDILLFGGQNLQVAGRNELTVDEIMAVYSSFVAAVRSGEIPEELVDEAVQRILDIKKKI